MSSRPAARAVEVLLLILAILLTLWVDTRPSAQNADAHRAATTTGR